MGEDDSREDQPTVEIRLAAIEDRLDAVAAIIKEVPPHIITPCHRSGYPPHEYPSPVYRGPEDPMAWLDSKHC
jgi:hypothetical protein